MKADLDLYQDFVAAVTSGESNNNDKFIVRFENLSQNRQVNTALLLTASMGLSSETGEFNEIVKKIFFQGKSLDDDNVYHMKRELGDIMWYWINACRALELDPNEVIAENVRKLESRYPGGKFDIFYSENRKKGDL